MAKTDAQRIQLIRAACQDHKNYWDRLRPEMRKYRNAYMTQFYKDSSYIDPASLRVETADGYAAIESVMGSLFSKYPGMELGADISGRGDLVVTRELINNWLKDSRTQIENAARMSLIYTHSFMKLAPRSSDTILGRIALRAVPPWQVVLDRDAAAYEDQRFIGHTYYISVDEANEKFGSKKWQGVEQIDYFTDYERPNSSYKSYGNGDELPNEYLYIEITEMYDMLNKELLFWTPQWKNGEELLSKDPIPVITYDGRPLSNLVPLFFSRVPDRPMEGYSAMARVYDQVFEKNILRSFWANAVRRDSRQYIYKEGAFDEDSLAKITSGVDGAMVPVDNDTLSGLIDIVPVVPLSSNFDRYLQMVEADLNKGSLTAGFTRGEATKATATEITALMQYTSSELGKMARDRDTMLEAASQLYVRMLIPLIDDGDALVISTPDGAKLVTPNAIDADWRFVAVDGGSTPMTDIVRKAQLTQLVPTLAQLGVPPDELKKELIRLYGLPPTFLEAQPPAIPALSAEPLPSTPTTPEAAVSSIIGGA